MASSANHTAAGHKHLRVLLPFTWDSLRIPDELADDIGARPARVVGPNSKVWTMEVRRDGSSAFLGHGWPQFVKECGVGAGWLVVLRHHGRGVLTVKAFDKTCCLRELAPAPSAATSSKGASRKPQFISLLLASSKEKMLIPPMFVQQCIPKEHLSNGTATTIIGPLGNVCTIELEMNQSDAWSKFVVFFGITEADALLLRYEGNLVFRTKVFGPDGCQRDEIKHIAQQCKQRIDTEVQQGIHTASFQQNPKNDRPCSYGKTNPNGSIQRRCIYNIGPPSWIKKPINTERVKERISLPANFCNAIGLREACTVTLKTSLTSTKSWKVRVLPYKNRTHEVGSGWKTFARKNKIRKGDVCTFNIVETMLWHVIIERQ